MKTSLAAAAVVMLTLAPVAFSQAKPAKPRMTQRDMVDQVLANTRPLAHPRGTRLPLYLWPLHGLGTTDAAEAEKLLKELDARGLPVLASWNPRRREASLKDGLWLGQLQEKLGLTISINATSCLHFFCDGSEKTAHVGDDGQPFFDFSFEAKRPMGCPFALEHRHEPIRNQLEPFLDAYKQAGLDIHFIFVDWEVDGPIEWNDAWAHSKRCTRCRARVPDIGDFAAFQKALREIRSRMQRECFARPVLKRFPRALVGNYAVYPNDGWRYWYDYFEKENTDLPFKADQRAKYRPWFAEFPACGYTVAMPVVYTWYPTFAWYDFASDDYRGARRDRLRAERGLEARGSGLAFEAAIDATLDRLADHLAGALAAERILEIARAR